MTNTFCTPLYMAPTSNLVHAYQINPSTPLVSSQIYAKIRTFESIFCVEAGTFDTNSLVRAIVFF